MNMTRPSDNRPPNRLSRERTHVRQRTELRRLVRVRKLREDWEQERFFRWLDKARPRHRYAHDSALAEAAGISHSTISNWRNGKQRPTLETLAGIARALDEEPTKLYELAGLLPTQSRNDELPAESTRRFDDPNEQELWDLGEQLRLTDRMRWTLISAYRVQLSMEEREERSS